MTEIKKEFKKGDMTIVWKAKLCIHAEICVKSLPDVYKPKERPWIKTENADEKQLKDQIDACPSGALTYSNDK